jgi:hypothetical protein
VLNAGDSAQQLSRCGDRADPLLDHAGELLDLPLAIAALVVAQSHPRPQAAEARRPAVTRARRSLSLSEDAAPRDVLVLRICHVRRALLQDAGLPSLVTARDRTKRMKQIGRRVATISACHRGKTRSPHTVPNTSAWRPAPALLRGRCGARISASAISGLCVMRTIRQVGSFRRRSASSP